MPGVPDAPLPDEPNDEEKLERLPQDKRTPFRPANDAANDPNDDPDRRIEASELDDTHQVTDSNMQAEEAYDEGYAGAAEANEPNAGNAVVKYDPERDKRRKRKNKEHGGG